MTKEQELYDKFVDVLTKKLNGEITPKELDVVLKFIQSQNLQATPEKHQGLNNLASKLPFDNENELPLKRIK